MTVPRFLCATLLFVCSLRGSGAHGEVLAYIAFDEVLTLGPQRVSELVAATGGEILYQGPMLRTGQASVEGLLLTMTEEEFAFLSSAPGMFPYPVSYVPLRYGGPPCPQWEAFASLPDCLVEVWIATPVTGNAAATRQAIEDFGGTYFGPSPPAFPGPHLVPIGRLQDLAADLRVGSLELFAPAGASAQGYPTDYVYQIALALGDGHRFQAQLGIESERIPLGSGIVRLSHLGKRKHLSKDSGAFWVLEPSNPEIFLKILDGCALNEHYWLFVSGLTDLGTILQVTDFGSETARHFRTKDGEPFSSVFDSQAFPCN